jgi:uncharacterized protein DUF1176
MLKPTVAAGAVLVTTCAGAFAEKVPAIPRAVLTAAMKQADCSRSLKDAMEAIEAYALGPKLKLVEVPCWLAAYQGGSILFAVDPAAPAKARLLRFQDYDGKKLRTTYSLTMPAFDEDKKILRSFHKGRGIGDCGSAGEWTWGGSDFKLAGYWIKDPCDGEPMEDEGEGADKWRVYPPKR